MTEFTARDDSFHFDRMSDRWWETETAWFSFCVPERRLGGWIYVMVRPNIGTVAGGAWVWDDTAELPWEALYSANYTALKLPAQDLIDITLPTGVSLKTLELLRSYQIGYRDEGRLALDLKFDAVMEPRALNRPNSAFKTLNHFDQFGRVTGQMILHGEAVPVDCLAMRDRSWGPRPEHRPNQSAYVSGIASPDLGFLAVTHVNEGSRSIAYGFLIQDGRAADLVSGRRTVTRDPLTGFVTTVVIEARDELGRDLCAAGERLSGIVINRHSFIDSNSLIAWTINGERGHGEDQDMWPVHLWSAMRRQAREPRPT
jgi:hypothetical protein